MEVASVLEVITAAVKIAWKTYEFLEAVAEAQKEAVELAERTKTIHVLTVCIQERLNESATFRKLDQPTCVVVERSLRACRQCLYQLQVNVRGYVPERDGARLTISSRLAHGFKWTFTKSSRQILISNLDTAIQDLQLPVTLLEQAKHGVTHDLIVKLARNVDAGFAHLNGIPESPKPSRGILPLGIGKSSSTQKNGADKNVCQEVYKSLRLNLSEVQSISRAQSCATSDIGSSVPWDNSRNAKRTLDLDRGIEELDPETPLTVDDSTIALDEHLAQLELAHTPTNSRLLHMFLKADRDRALKAIERQQFSAAESHLEQALKRGAELEQRNEQSFPERQEIELQLVFVYEQQERHAQAVAKLNGILSKLPRNVCDEDDLKIAQIDVMYARNQYQMARSARTDGNIERAESNLATADKYIISTLSKLMELEEKCVITQDDATLLECAKLAVDILEDNKNPAEAQVIREEYLKQGRSGATITDDVQDTQDLTRAYTNSTVASSIAERSIDDPMPPPPQSAGLPALSAAIISGTFERAHTILAQMEAHSPLLNEHCIVRGWTPLMYAAECQHPARGRFEPCQPCVRLLECMVQKGADLNAVDVRPAQSRSRHSPVTVLHQACKRGDRDMVQRLVRADINVNTCSPQTALVVAVKEKRADILKILLDHRADVTVWDTHRQTPLHHAALNADIACLRLLIQAQPRDTTGRNMSISAVDTASLDPATEVGRRPSPYFSSKDASGKTPLHLASSRAGYGDTSYQIAELLLENRADPDAVDNAGQTPLTMAAQNPRTPADAIQMLKLLLKHGADPSLGAPLARRYFSNYQSKEGLAALHTASPKDTTKTRRRRASNMSESSRFSEGGTATSQLIAANQGVRRDSHLSASSEGSSTVAQIRKKRLGSLLSKFSGADAR